jgi:hypothetical protein
MPFFRALSLLSSSICRLRQKALAAVKPGDEYDVKNQKVGVVEIDADTFIFRTAGGNKKVPRDKIPAGIVLAIVMQWFDANPANDLYIGAYHLAKPEPDPEKARVVREEMLFYTRQKVTDLLTQLAVNIQGYLALDLVRKNNLELVKGVDRATTTTVSALRTAVIVAQALNNQKLVLDQISALNTTTGNLINATSEMLRDQGTAIQQQAASSTIEIATLQKAFANVYQSMDAISDFKTKALASMQTTVDTLGSEITKSRSYLDRVRKEEAREATAPPGEVAL